MLRCAIVLSWPEFAGTAELQKIQLAYELDAEGGIGNLKIWSSPRRGEWNFVCDYWMKEGELHLAGARFATNRCPAGFEKVLARIMQNQSKFAQPASGPQGMIVVLAPSGDDRASAEQTMELAFA